MAKIKIAKVSADELHGRAANIGMVEAHGLSMIVAKQRAAKSIDPGRRRHFKDQVQAHLNASTEHFRAARYTDPNTKPYTTFEAKDHAITPMSKRIYN